MKTKRRKTSKRSRITSLKRRIASTKSVEIPQFRRRTTSIKRRDYYIKRRVASKA